MGIKRRTQTLIIGAILSCLLGACLDYYASASSAQISAEQGVGAVIGGNWVVVKTGNDVNIEVVPTETGTLSIGKSSVSVKTNSPTGYRLYISGQSAEDDGYASLYFNGVKSNLDKIDSIHTTATPEPFGTPNLWGYALAGDGSNGFSTGNLYDKLITENEGTTTETSTINSLKWKGIKKDYTILTSSGHANPDAFEDIPIYFGVYADNNNRKGSYRNTVVYTAFVDGSTNIYVRPEKVWDGDTILIDTEHQNPTALPVSAQNIELTLYNKDNASANIATCDNIVIDETYNGSYGNPLRFTCTIHRGPDAETDKPYDTILRIEPLNNGIYVSYTAENNWSFVKTLASIKTMQEITPEICANTPEWDPENSVATTYVLTDDRVLNDVTSNDGKRSYLVRKMPDGNCWMVQNLAVTGGTALTADGSDLNDKVSYTLPASDQTASGRWNSNANTTGYMFNGTHQDATFDTGITEANKSTTNTGGYYSYVVATAGLAPATSTGYVPSSICPKGWKLPSGDTSGQFQKLYDSWINGGINFSSHVKRATAWGSYTNNAFQYASYCNSSACPNLYGASHWQSNTIASASGEYYMYMNDSDFAPQHTSSKQYGFSIRCIASPTYDYSIAYDANAGNDAVSSIPATTSAHQTIAEHTSSGGQATLTISSTTPTRSGYAFAGWSTDKNTTMADPTYTPGTTHTLSDANSKLTLYAVWYVPMANNAYMQDMTAESCNHATGWTSSNGVQYRLKDRRGSQYTYTVRKLADNNCWMVQNLALPGDTAITNQDSDLNTISTYQLPSSSNSTSNRWNDNTSITGYMYNGNHDENATTDTPITTANTTSSNSGAYYSYVVATAGYAPTIASGTAPNSICPRNWKLPTGGPVDDTQTPPRGQFQTLYSKYNDYSAMKTAFQAVYAAYCNSSACPSKDTRAYWWSSTISSATHGYNMAMGSSSFYLQDYSNKYHGFSVRCVLAGA